MGRPEPKHLLICFGLVLLSLSALIRNVRMLVLSRRFYEEVKDKPEHRLDKTEAVVKYCRDGGRSLSTTAAVVFYDKDGKSTEARMICAGCRRLLLGDRISVLIYKGTGRLFAYDAAQIQEAKLIYLVYCVLSAAAVIATLALALYAIVCYI